MSRRVCGLFVCAFFMVALSGCMESATVLQVNKDGSGTILVREFLSPETLSMMGGFGSMLDEMAEASGGESEDVDGLGDLPVIMRGMVVERAKEYGDSVRLTAVREVTNDRDWQGYMARFEFDDVNAVRLKSASADDGDAETEYRLAFTPGATAELRLIPGKPADVVAADFMPEFGMDDMEVEGDMDVPMDMSGMMEGMDDAMSAMFGNMFKGMRMSVYVDVEGDIVETDAMHRSESRPNRVALVDMDFDKLMSHPEALNRLMSNDPASVFKLQEEGAPGLLMEDPDKPVTIRFR